MSPTLQQEARAFQFGRGKAKVKKQAEGSIVNDCIHWLFAHGCFVWRNNTGQYTKHYERKRTNDIAKYTIRYGKPGSGDVIGVTRNGIHIEVEAKTKGGEQTPQQQEHQRLIEEKGGIYILAANGIDDLIARKDEILGRGP